MYFYGDAPNWSFILLGRLVEPAVQGVDEMSKQGALFDFQSKVDLFLQYSYMFPGISQKIYKQTLPELFKWGKWQEVADLDSKTCNEISQDETKMKEIKINNSNILVKLNKYMFQKEKVYDKYNVGSDINRELFEAMEEQLEQTEFINEQTTRLSEQMKDVKRLTNILVGQTRDMKEETNKHAQQIKDIMEQLLKQNEKNELHNDRELKQNKELTVLVSNLISKLDR